MNNTASITSFIVSRFACDELYKLFQYAPTIKYLKITLLFLSDTGNNKLNLDNINDTRVKQLIIECCCVNFENVQALLNIMPNLIKLTLSNAYVDQSDFSDAVLWEDLIIFTLPHLKNFNFRWYFQVYDTNNIVFNKFQRFQTDFWLKQHVWFTNYEIFENSAAIYTTPYPLHEYNQVPIDNEYFNLSINQSNVFNNVTDLSLVLETMMYNDRHYFPNVKSLRHLCIPKYISIESPHILLQMLNETPQLSSLTVDTSLFISFLNDSELCEYLNRKIKKLKILLYHDCLLINSATRVIYYLY